VESQLIESSVVASAVADAKTDPNLQNSLSANPFKVLSAPPYSLTLDDFVTAYDAPDAIPPFPPLPPPTPHPPYGADVPERNLLRVLSAPPHNRTLNDLIATYDKHGTIPWPAPANGKP